MPDAARRLPLAFPVHPRTRRSLADFGLLPRLEAEPRIRLVEPLGYVSFMALVSGARCAITDSGGVQEETTYLGIPCLTLRDTTERPVTVTLGTNRLVSREGLGAALDAVLRGAWPEGRRPPGWDGRAATRVADSIGRWFAGGAAPTSGGGRPAS